jgi:capsular exopolysaccharide synthesis family protein
VARPHDRIITVTRPESRSSQAFHELVARIRFEISALPGTAGRGAVLMCTSAKHGEGKTEVAVNVAVAAARAGMQVIYVDADLRRAPGDRLREVPEDAPGLADVLIDGIRLERLLVEGPATNVSILPAGVVPDDPTGLTSSARMRPVLAALAERADLVVVDASPNAHFADSLEIAGLADLTLLVTRLGRSRVSTVGAAADRLHDVGAANVGTVVMGTAGKERSARSPRPPATTRTGSLPASGERAHELVEPSFRDRAQEDLRVRQSPRG